MRVVLVSLARRGGMVHFLAELAGCLAPLARVVVVASSAASLDYLAASVEVARVNTGNGPLGSLARVLSPFTWWRVAAVLRDLQPDVVHIAGSHEWNPFVAVLCRLQGVPLVYTVHDPLAHPGAPWGIRVADKITLRLASRLVALTEDGRRQLLASGAAPQRVDVVPHPMYTLFRRWLPRAVKQQKVILSFGRLEAYKGLEMLIEAFQRIRPTLPGWRLIIAGEGQLSEAVRNEHLPDIEIIRGYVPDKDVALLFSRCAIVALPYASASQSGVIALAQAFNRPVVSTRVGGLSEMVIPGATGILVRPADGAAFGRALRQLATHPELRARMGRSIRKIAAARWGPRIIGQAHMDVYARAVRAQEVN